MSESRRRKSLTKAQAMLFCSFCHKSHMEVAKLVAGPAAYICDICIRAAAEQMKKPVRGKGFKGYDAQPAAQLLKLLKPASAILDAVREDLQAKIDSLRRRNVSWAEIGAALGTSRQAAWERFS
ncbi:MAG: hypothetical protein JOZ55_04345 [Alphaproteobacteria bacterium]|nr:hypothetical protein [Alphaproteobacteria bacterium]